MFYDWKTISEYSSITLIQLFIYYGKMAADSWPTCPFDL